MIKVINTIIPFKGFKATTVFPFVFIRKDEKERFDSVTENHEAIHYEQQLEMLVAGSLLALLLYILTASLFCLLCFPLFFWWYLTEWALRAAFCTGNAYRNISFEREAYDKERDLCYLYRRPAFGWVRYMFNK